MWALVLVLLSGYTNRFVPDELVVWFEKSVRKKIESYMTSSYERDALVYRIEKAGIPEFDNLCEKHGVKEIRRLIVGKMTEKAKAFDLDLFYILKFDEPKDIPRLAEEFNSLPCIRDAFPNWIMDVVDEPNDPYFGSDYWTKQWYLPQIEAPKAWDITHGDPNILVGPVDTGVKWDHPDLISKFWVNPGEDLNQNGVFDYPEDLNGEDDDGDGYIDDIIGFNFFHNTWDPSQGDCDHGTHVFGIIAAATNNGEGVAGVGWDVRGMGLKAGDGMSINIGAAVNAIYFAANHGVAVTNHSYGGMYNSAEAQAMAYAHDSCNVTICASAGNENVEIPLYPAANPNVIAVGATNAADKKSSFSNYGIWVDVMAPGEQIISTYWQGGYVAYSGTSMSSPIAAGIASLIRSLNPDFTSFETDSFLMWGCDPIDELNPDYQGKLGYGRVNAYKSVAMTIYSYPKLIHYDFDGGVRISPGETYNLNIVIENLPHWRNIDNLNISLSTDDPLIAITDSVENVSTLAAGDTATLVNAFTIQVEGEKRFVNFIINYDCNPQAAYNSETLRVVVGNPEVVLVNDSKTTILSQYYTDVLDSFGVIYEVWNLPEISLLSLREANPIAVLWFTGGDSEEVLTSSEIDTILNYLNTEKSSFIISSQYLLEDPDAQDFVLNYLKASARETGTVYKVVKGYDGNRIGDSLFFQLYGTGSAENNLSPDIIEPQPGADSAFYLTNPRGSSNYGPSAVYYQEGERKVFFASFALEAISDGGANRNSRYDVLARILDWAGVPVAVAEKQRLYLKPQKISISSTLTKGEIEFSFVSDSPSRELLSVYDISGRVVISKIFEIKKGNNKLRLDLSQLRSGVYFVRLKNGKSKTFKVIRVGM